MKTLKKKSIAARSALAAILIVLAVMLVTCDEFLFPGKNGGEEDTQFVDWEYVDLPDGRAELTLYLDGTQVPVTEKTKKQQANRALNLPLAKMSHDYFEAVFYDPTSNTTARASWELGQAAGISGVARSGLGVNYTGLDASGGPASTVFVGRKQTMTLMGIGYLTHINKTLIASGKLLTTADRSVTFTVSALNTKIAIDPVNKIAVTGSSFVTAAGTPPYTVANEGNTTGNVTALGGADYPLFSLPDHNQISALTSPPATVTAGTLLSDGTDVGGHYLIASKYTVSWIDADGTAGTPTDIMTAVKLVDKPEVIKREPRYVSGGQTWYAVAQIDSAATKVDVVGYTAVPGDAFNPVIPINFYISTASNGIFSIVFSVPVIALTSEVDDDSTATPKTHKPTASTNGGPAGEIWHITPGFGQNLYNLDNGLDAGGCVLMGINVSSLDWLEIFTTGVGFKH